MMHVSTKKLSGDLIKDGLSEDGKQKYLMIRRIFITVGVRELHLLMMKEKKRWWVRKSMARATRWKQDCQILQELPATLLAQLVEGDVR